MYFLDFSKYYVYFVKPCKFHRYFTICKKISLFNTCYSLVTVTCNEELHMNRYMDKHKDYKKQLIIQNVLLLGFTLFCKSLKTFS